MSRFGGVSMYSVPIELPLVRGGPEVPGTLKILLKALLLRGTGAGWRDGTEGPGAGGRSGPQERAEEDARDALQLWST